MFFRFIPILALVACTNSSISPPDTITTIVSAPVPNLNPIYATDANSQHINDLTHAGLLKISEKLLPEPYLAESFKVLNNTTLEFTLREGCKFPNGKIITSKDVERSWQYYTNEKNASPYLEQFKKIIRIEIIDDKTFRFYTEKPLASLPTDLYSLKIMQLDPPPVEAKPTDIPGAGPYRMQSFSPKEILLTRREETNCLPLAASPKIKIKVVRDDLSRFLKLKNGELDIVLNEMNFRKAETVEKDPSLGLVTMKSDGIGYNYIGVNMVNEKLRDPRVREAIALSIDFPTIIKYKNRGMATPARNLLSDKNFYANLDVPMRTRDLNKARALLDQAGFFNGSNGKPALRVTLKTTTALSSIENARVIVAQAREAGIEIDHKSFDWGIFYNDIKTGNSELYLLRWVGVTDPGIYFEVFHSGEIGRNNRTKYKNPEMDKWIEKGQATLDPKERKKAFDEVQKIADRDLPYIGMWYPMNVAVYRKELKNVSLHPTGSWINFTQMRKE